MQALVEGGGVVIEAPEDVPPIDRVAESREEGEDDNSEEVPRLPAPNLANPPQPQPANVPANGSN
jgi:hypothetical protein